MMSSATTYNSRFDLSYVLALVCIVLAMSQLMCSHFSSCLLKLAFHDADTDSDLPDTSIHPYVRYVRFPREEVRVGVEVMECDTDILADRHEEIACVGLYPCLESRCRCQRCGMSALLKLAFVVESRPTGPITHYIHRVSEKKHPLILLAITIS